MKYEITVGGKSSESKMLFTSEKNIVRIIGDAKCINL
jgi:hypothetical protein